MQVASAIEYKPTYKLHIQHAKLQKKSLDAIFFCKNTFIIVSLWFFV